MPRKTVPKTSFLGGEAGPLLEGRSELPQYQLGLSPGENWIALKSGGVTRRPPTSYIKETQGTATPGRLIPFEISRDTLAEQFAVEITQPSAGTTLVFRVIRASGSNTVFTPTGSPLTVANTVSTGTVDLNDIQYSQSGDMLFIVGKGFEPQILKMTPDPTQILGGGRVGTTPTFTLSPYIAYTSSSRDAWLSMPYRTPNVSATTLKVDNNAVGTGRTLTATTAIFSQSHIGAYFSQTEGGITGYARITAVGGSGLQLTATAEVVKAWFAPNSAVADWAEGSWSEYRGWPRTVCQYGQRLIMGGNTYEPDTVWMTQVGDLLQMHAESAAIDDPLNFTLSAERANHINWMVGGKKLTVGTATSEWVGQVTNDGTNLFVNFDEETTHGGALVMPAKSSYAVPFVQNAGTSIREILYSFDSDSYVATDLTLFGSHVGSNGEIVQLAYQEAPHNVLWAIDSSGGLYGLTRDRQVQVAAWHSHKIGGEHSDGTVTKVRSICVLGSDLWMIVERQLDNAGATPPSARYFVERMGPGSFHSTIDPRTSGLIHLDSYKQSTGASATLWTGFTHLQNNDAYVIGYDNSTGLINHNGVLSVNSSGEITLPVACTGIIAGLHARAVARLLPFEGGEDPEFKNMGTKRADRAHIRLHKSFGLKIGKNRTARKTGWEENDTFEPIPFDQTEAPPLPTFTGVKEVAVPTGSDTDGSFALAMEDPWPCTILSITSRVVANEI